MNFTKPKGTYDVLPGEAEKWQNIERLIREVCAVFNYKEIRTPMFESSQIYHRAAGETSDIVSKETYDFLDRGERSMTLRPEGTAGAVRSFVENKLHASGLVQKLFYIGPMFRYERQQKGRYRQHVQFGTEVFGSADPAVDAEVISLAVSLYEFLGLKSVKVKVNSLGDSESRERYREALLMHFEGHQEELCSDCQTRLEKNPLRVLDCKADADKEIMKTAPEILDYLIPEDKAYFENVQKYLKTMGIQYEYDASLVRGFDYYTHTIFEIQADIQGFGSQNTLCGGGRYNNLVGEFGGPATPAIGFGMGLERLLLALEAEGIQLAGDEAVDVYMMFLGEDAKVFGSRLLLDLRMRGLVCETDYLEKNMKGKFKQAERYNAKYVVIMGDSEMENGVVNIKNTKTGEQESVAIHQIMDYIVLDQQNQQRGGGCGCGGHGHGGGGCCGGGGSCGCGGH